MAVEIIRPTDFTGSGSWTTPANGYDGNTNTSASLLNPNSTPAGSWGGSAGAEGTAAWQTKSFSWTSAIVYFWFSKDAGSNDTVEVLVTDQNGTLRHTLVASTFGAVTKQEFSVALNSADWGGAGFPNIANLRIRVNGSKSGGFDGSTSFVYDARIEGQYTPPAALFDASVVAAATVAIALTTAITFGGSVTASASSTPTLTTDITFGSAISSSAAVSGTLTTEITLAGTAAATASLPPPNLWTLSLFEAAPTASASASAELATDITFASAIISTATAVSQLTIPSIELAAAITTATTLGGDLVTEIICSGSAAASINAAPTLTTEIPFDATVTATAILDAANLLNHVLLDDTVQTVVIAETLHITKVAQTSAPLVTTVIFDEFAA